MTIIKIIFALINAILRAATSSFLLLVSTLISAIAVLTLVGFLAFGLSGVVGLRLSRRRTARRDRE